ncbi:MAG: metallophosphoesterase [Oscillospiraceae bacterium]|nr:metallophosphoesterase [Oscillospiraceae bacterium]
MKILVLSDSHASLSFMYSCVETVKPDAMIHLGDYYDDSEALKERYPHIPLYRVPGNCDRYRCPPGIQDIQINRVLGVELYMTHGHRHNVKMYTGKLIRDARECKVQAVLYGHTHEAECYQEDGLWVLNPGSCGGYGGTAAIMDVENGKIKNCRIISHRDLEEMA